MNPDRHDTRVLEWLLAGDPSIRWQAFHDLTAAPPVTNPKFGVQDSGVAG